MTDEAFFGVAVVGLLVAIGLGFRRWDNIAGAGLATRFVLISTALGGLMGAPFWWFDLPASFAWDLPPVGSRLLAAAALAFGVAGIIVLERPTAARIRLYFMLIALYLIPLALAVVFIHLDRFDFAKPVTYGFFAVVVVLSLGSLMGIFNGPVSSSAASDRGAGSVASAWLAVAGGVLAIWGMALFAMPGGSPPLIFNWPTDPLTSRLIASMLFTLGAAFLLSRGNSSLERLSLGFGGVYGLAALAACVMNISAGKPVPPLYAVVLGVVGLVSMALFFMAPAGAPATRTRAAG